jgi:uncharacterized protein (DUF1015 family)
VDLSRVLAPPYDVISRADRARLYDRDPHCAVRLELTRDADAEASTDYSEISDRLRAWREARVLVRDERPALYGLRQSFTAPDGTRAAREGFFGLLHLEDYERRIVRPHERTLAAPKADRLKLLRATRANLSSVFLLYEDREAELPGLLAPGFEGSRVAEAHDEAGGTQTLMRLEDPERIASSCCAPPGPIYPASSSSTRTARPSCRGCWRPASRGAGLPRRTTRRGAPRP